MLFYIKPYKESIFIDLYTNFNNEVYPFIVILTVRFKVVYEIHHLIGTTHVV